MKCNSRYGFCCNLASWSYNFFNLRVIKIKLAENDLRLINLRKSFSSISGLRYVSCVRLMFAVVTIIWISLRCAFVFKRLGACVVLSTFIVIRWLFKCKESAKGFKQQELLSGRVSGDPGTLGGFAPSKKNRQIRCSTHPSNEVTFAYWPISARALLVIFRLI